MISSTAGLTSFLQSHSKHSFRPPSGFPPWPLYSLRPQPTSQMQGTATQVPHPWYSLSSTWTPLLRLRSLQSSSYLGTKTFHKSFAKLPGQVAGAAEKNFNNQPSSTKKTSPLPSSSVSHLPSQSIRLALPSYQLTTTFCPLAALLPSTSPHQHSSMPHHHLRRLLPALHNSPDKKKASHAFIWSNNGEIPATKMTANKQKANLKNIQCSHQWGDLLFGHSLSWCAVWIICVWENVPR